MVRRGDQKGRVTLPDITIGLRDPQPFRCAWLWKPEKLACERNFPVFTLFYACRPSSAKYPFYIYE